MTMILGFVVLIMIGLFAVGWLIPLILGIVRLKKGVRTAGTVLTVIGGIWGLFAIIFVGFGIYGFTMISKSMNVEEFDAASYKGPMGKINMSYKGDFSIDLRKTEDAKLQKFNGKAGTVSVPVGTYAPVSFNLLMKDKQGREWTAGTYFISETNNIQVTPDSAAEIKAGPPFEAITSAEKSGKGNVSINLDFKGSDGREYTLNCYEIEDPPGFVVLSKSREKLWEGRFEAG